MPRFTTEWTPEALQLRLAASAAIDALPRITPRSAGLRLDHLDTISGFTRGQISAAQAENAFSAILRAARST